MLGIGDAVMQKAEDNEMLQHGIHQGLFPALWNFARSQQTCLGWLVPWHGTQWDVGAWDLCPRTRLMVCLGKNNQVSEQ